MKNKLLFPIILGLLVGCGGTTSSQNQSIQSIEEIDPNAVDVVILAGQSNMEGNTKWSPLSTELKTYYKEGFGKSLISYEMTGYSNLHNNMEVDDEVVSCFDPVTLGQAYGRDRFGPEVGIAEKIEESNRENPVYFIKFCSGGTSLFQDWRSPTSSSTPGRLWNRLINAVDRGLATLEDEGYNPVIKAFCWMQGESDSSYASFYELYENNFINDFNDFYYDYISEKGLKFIDAGISDGRNPEDTAYVWDYYRINQAKVNNQARDSENRFYIDTIAEGLLTDPHNQRGGDLYHYDAESMVKLGHLFGDVLLNNNII